MLIESASAFNQLTIRPGLFHSFGTLHPLSLARRVAAKGHQTLVRADAS